MRAAPTVRKISRIFTEHGNVRDDEYYWLRERDNPEVIAYIKAENAYYDAVMKPLQPLANSLYQGMVARIPASEDGVPIQLGDYFYYIREEKDLQYQIYARKEAASRAELATAPEEILLDVNSLAIAAGQDGGLDDGGVDGAADGAPDDGAGGGDDSEDGGYLDVTALRLVSNNQRYLAYLENRDGTDKYTCFIKDLATRELLPDVIPNVADESVGWSADDKYIFYVTLDDTQRANKFWRHELGTSATDDVLLYEEQDDTFILLCHTSQSRRFIFLCSLATNTTEVRVIDTTNPLAAPILLQPRREGVEYALEHWRDDLLIITNENALNFKLLRLPLAQLKDSLTDSDLTNSALIDGGQGSWGGTEVVPYDEERFLEWVYPFAQRLYVSGRENGLKQIWYLENGKLVPLAWDEAVYNLVPAPLQSYQAPEFVVSYSSFITPPTDYAINNLTTEKTLIKQQQVAGSYDATQYTQKHLFATASDGTKIPILLHYRTDALANGPAPLLLSAYGAYGFSSDPYFYGEHLPLLDKGVILATAQIRGGSEYGRGWYYAGRMQHKQNTFSDFSAAAKYLITEGYTNTEMLAGYGASAGGLLIGATANQAGDIFKVLVAEAPFVDVINTMLDPTIPLTTEEYEEWGNPNNADAYRTMLAYSPYDNVTAKEYPAMYVTTGINDPRVSYWEPLKWVAKLRELKTDHNILVLKTNLNAGHFGASGRLAHLKEYSQMLAFVLSQIAPDAVSIIEPV